jgi:hypothetical protein
LTELFSKEGESDSPAGINNSLDVGACEELASFACAIPAIAEEPVSRNKPAAAERTFLLRLKFIPFSNVYLEKLAPLPKSVAESGKGKID